MSSFAEMIGRLDASSQQPLYQQLQRALARRDRRQGAGRRRRPAARARPGRAVLGLAHHRAQGAGRPGRGRPADAPPGLGHLRRRRPGGEELLQAVSSFTEDMAARGRTPHSVWLSRSEGTGDARGIADPGPAARHARSIASRGSAMPTTRRWRWNTRPSRPSACPRSRRWRSRSTRRWRSRGCRPARALQRLRAVLFTDGAGRAAGRAPARRGPADRAPRLAGERPGGRVHPVLLSRRRLRLRRRAERSGPEPRWRRDRRRSRPRSRRRTHPHVRRGRRGAARGRPPARRQRARGAKALGERLRALDPPRWWSPARAAAPTTRRPSPST